MLARGRFTTPLETEGFDVFGSLPAPPARTTKAAPAADKRKANEELRQAKARLRELEQQMRRPSGRPRG